MTPTAPILPLALLVLGGMAWAVWEWRRGWKGEMDETGFHLGARGPDGVGGGDCVGLGQHNE
jgi:hypothetical protein